MTTPIEETNQAIRPGPYIELFDLDLTEIGGSQIIYFTSAEDASGDPIMWQGNEYLPVPIAATGFEVMGDHSFPRPRLTLSNILGTGVELLQTTLDLPNGTLRGAKVTRWRTWAKHLDDGSDPNPNAHFLPDVYFISRKVNEDFLVVEWEMMSRLDMKGHKIGRLMFRNACDHTARVWDGAAFVDGTCPWKVGGDNYTTTYYNKNGEVVATAAEEEFSKRLGTCCRVRYGRNQVPFRGFPSIGRFR